MTGGLIALGTLGLFFSLALLDAANAFKNHDQALQTADIMLYVSASAGGLGSLALFTVVLFLRRLKKALKEAAAV